MLTAKGFSLLECMVVVAIIGILAHLSIPGIRTMIGIQKRMDASIEEGQAVVTALQNNELIRICAVDDNCIGNTLLCVQSNRLRTCTETTPCLFVDGNWKHGSKLCGEGVLSLVN